MLRLFSRRLPYRPVHRGLSSAQLIARYSAVTGCGSHRKRQYHHSGSYNASESSDYIAWAAVGGAVLGTAWYMWRRNKVFCELPLPPRPIIVEWQPPPPKPRRRRNILKPEDVGDSKSMDKSTLAGADLEILPKIPDITPPSTSPPPPPKPSVEPPVSSTPPPPPPPPPPSAADVPPEKETTTPPPAQEEKPPQEEKEEDLSKEQLEALREYLESYEEPVYIDESLIGPPESVPYLIIGSGTAAIAAARAIRGSDATARVLIIGDEPHAPYMRPPLSKELWRRKRERQDQMLAGTGDMKRHSWMFFEPNNFFLPADHLNACTFGGVALWRKKRVVRLNVDERFAELSTGERVHFGKCLLATGGRPRRLPAMEAAAAANAKVGQRLLYFRNIADFEQLRGVAEKGGRVVVIGGGFLGSELTVSLADVARKSEPEKLSVVQVYRETDGNMAHVLPKYLADYTRKFVEGKGVTVISGNDVSDASWNPDSKKVKLSLTHHDPVEADFVVVAVGLEANTDLADDAQLELDHIRGGFLVNAELEARDGVYAAGDASSYYDLLLGRRRVEHINHAEESGRIAGRNMAGEHLPYHHQSSFWSTLGREISWDAIGLIDSKLETHAFFALPPAEKGKAPQNAERDYSLPGVVFYMKARRVVGILLWNLPDDIYKDEQRYAPSRLNLVRKVLDERRRYSPEELAKLARDFDLYETIAEDFADLQQFMKEKEKEKVPA